MEDASKWMYKMRGSPQPSDVPWRNPRSPRSPRDVVAKSSSPSLGAKSAASPTMPRAFAGLSVLAKMYPADYAPWGSTANATPAIRKSPRSSSRSSSPSGSPRLHTASAALSPRAAELRLQLTLLQADFYRLFAEHLSLQDRVMHLAEDAERGVRVQGKYEEAVGRLDALEVEAERLEATAEASIAVDSGDAPAKPTAQLSNARVRELVMALHVRMTQAEADAIDARHKTARMECALSEAQREAETAAEQLADEKLASAGLRRALFGKAADEAERAGREQDGEEVERAVARKTLAAQLAERNASLEACEARCAALRFEVSRKDALIAKLQEQVRNDEEEGQAKEKKRGASAARQKMAAAVADAVMTDAAAVFSFNGGANVTGISSNALVLSPVQASASAHTEEGGATKGVEKNDALKLSPMQESVYVEPTEGGRAIKGDERDGGATSAEGEGGEECGSNDSYARLSRIELQRECAVHGSIATWEY